MPRKLTSPQLALSTLFLLLVFKNLPHSLPFLKKHQLDFKNFMCKFPQYPEISFIQVEKVELMQSNQVPSDTPSPTFVCLFLCKDLFSCQTRWVKQKQAECLHITEGSRLQMTETPTHAGLDKRHNLFNHGWKSRGSLI